MFGVSELAAHGMAPTVLPGFTPDGYVRQALASRAGGVKFILAFLVGVVVLCGLPSVPHSEPVHHEPDKLVSLSADNAAHLPSPGAECGTDGVPSFNPAGRGYIAGLALLLASLILRALYRGYRVWNKDFSLRPIEPPMPPGLLRPPISFGASRLQVLLL